jgi:hypothetical protein
MPGGDNIFSTIGTASIEAIKKAPKNILTSLRKRGSSNYGPSNIYEFVGNNIKDIQREHNEEFRKAAGQQFNEARKKRQMQANNTQTRRPPLAPIKGRISPILSPIALSSRSPSPAFSRSPSPAFSRSPSPGFSNSSASFNHGFFPISRSSTPINLAGGMKRPGSPLNNNRTVKRARRNSNSNSNSNNTVFSLYLDPNIARTIQRRSRRVQFTPNVNYTVKRASQFEEEILPNLIDEGATENNIEAALKNYQANQSARATRKMRLPRYAKTTIQNAAHKFANFIKNINTITYESEYAYEDLKTIFAMIKTLPYKTVTKKRMMQHAWKQLGYSKTNNNSGDRVMLVTPEQQAELVEEMRIMATNWN